MLGLVVLIAILVPAGPLGVDRSWSEAMRDIETPCSPTSLTDVIAGSLLGSGISLLVFAMAQRHQSIGQQLGNKRPERFR